MAYKKSIYYEISFEAFKIISPLAYSFEFLIPAKNNEGSDTSFSMVFPKSQVELDVDTNVVYASSWILKQKLKNSSKDK